MREGFPPKAEALFVCGKKLMMSSLRKQGSPKMIAIPIRTVGDNQRFALLNKARSPHQVRDDVAWGC